MKKQNNRKVYGDKDGHEYHRERYFVGGKMKFRRVYLIDGIPADEFYEKNATVIEMVIDGDFHLADDKSNSDNCYDEPSPSDKRDVRDLPF